MKNIKLRNVYQLSINQIRNAYIGLKRLYNSKIDFNTFVKHIRLLEARDLIILPNAIADKDGRVFITLFNYCQCLIQERRPNKYKSTKMHMKGEPLYEVYF